MGSRIQHFAGAEEVSTGYQMNSCVIHYEAGVGADGCTASHLSFCSGNALLHVTDCDFLGFLFLETLQSAWVGDAAADASEFCDEL